MPLDDLFPLLAARVTVPEHGPVAAVSFRPTRVGKTEGYARHPIGTV